MHRVNGSEHVQRDIEGRGGRSNEKRHYSHRIDLSFFFLHVLRLYATLWVMADITLVLLHLFSSLIKCPYPFLVALSRRICFCRFLVVFLPP